MNAGIVGSLKTSGIASWVLLKQPFCITLLKKDVVLRRTLSHPSNYRKLVQDVC